MDTYNLIEGSEEQMRRVLKGVDSQTDIFMLDDFKERAYEVTVKFFYNVTPKTIHEKVLKEYVTTATISDGKISIEQRVAKMFPNIVELTVKHKEK